MPLSIRQNAGTSSTPTVDWRGIPNNGEHDTNSQTQVTSPLDSMTGSQTSLEASATSDPNVPSNQTSSTSGTSAGAIAGGVIGGVVLLALIVVAFLFVRRRKRRMAPSSEFLARNPNWRSSTPNSFSQLTGEEPPPFTQGSYNYPLQPEKHQRSQPV